MSYILDALKKSDRERQRQTPTSLVTPQSEFRARGGGAPPYAMSLMVAALVIAAAAGGALFARTWREPPAPPLEPPTMPPASKEAAPVPAPAVDSPVVADQPVAGLPVEDVSTPVPALLEIWQLTEAEQKYLGTLEVSMHVHSSEPAQRTVIVNGLRVREGQALGQDIRLLEITPDGMIVEFQGKHVRLVTVQGA